MHSKLPEQMLQSLQQVKGFDKEAFVAVHNNKTQVVSIRLNPSKMSDHEVLLFPRAEKIPWSVNGYYLPSRPSFTLDPFLHAGAYYVQEASGMFIEQCLSQLADLSMAVKVLDLCAAPGGKSTLVQSMISRNSLLVSNEVIKTRVNVLVENLSKWGAANIIVTNNDPRDFSRLENYFDIMIVDAPCSGSGLFRKDPNAIEEWSMEAVQSCRFRQQRVLGDAYSALKQNGLLIYSTCSYSEEENESICDWLMEKFDMSSLPVKISPEWNIIETASEKYNANGYRFFPDKLRGEGFFVACFRKNDGGTELSAINKKDRLTAASAREKSVINPWIKHPENYTLFHFNNELFAFPKILENELQKIQQNLYIKKAGVPVGRLVRDELVPAHELAVSEIVNDQLLTVSLKKEDALQYLRKEEVTLQSDIRGWALVRYNGQNIGWVKILSNRINNYYPKEWRILKSGNN